MANTTDPRSAGRRGCLTFLLSLLGTLPAAGTVHVDLCVTDPSGAPLAARVHIRDSAGAPYPGHPDETLLSHEALGGYFYVDGCAGLDLPAGITDLVVGRGFEWRPQQLLVDLQRDTLLAVALARVCDLRAQGWYSGDPHTHTRHDPIDYPLTPALVHRIARAEDLAQIYALDQDHEFTGCPHAVSTPEASVYYATEFRNCALGHVCLLGLRAASPFGDGCCCRFPSSVVPMLSTVHEVWDPDYGQAMLLTHPHTDAGFFEDQTWPGTGLGRELPMLAASGNLDLLDAANYSNEPDVYLRDWHALLSCGLASAPVGSTDANLASYSSRPGGGYRTYAEETPGAPHDPDAWVESLKHGRTFLTNYPLIPWFSVDGARPGDTLHVAGPAAAVSVAFHVISALPVAYASVIVNGQPHTIVALPGSAEGTDVRDTLNIGIEESCWLALRVDGQTSSRHAVDPALFAHTAAVQVHVDGQPVRSTLPAGRFLDWLDSLDTYMELRDSWPNEVEHQLALVRLAEARHFYLAYFTLPPDLFPLIAPQVDKVCSPGVPVFFDWGDAVDPEPGDRVVYVLQIADDEELQSIRYSLGTAASTATFVLPLEPGHPYWWNVKARDRAGNVTLSDPPSRRFFLGEEPGAVSEPDTLPPPRAGRAGERAPVLRIAPNPAAGEVEFSLRAESSGPWEIMILDAAGRVILCGSGREGIAGVLRKTGSGRLVWNRCDGLGRPVASGSYWVRCRSAGDSRAAHASASSWSAARLLVLR